MAAAPKSAHLSLVRAGPANSEDELMLFVRAVRRDMGRLLRALQATGRGVATLPDPVTTRLAHVDAVTARYLLEPDTQIRSEVRAAANSMRALERWIVERLSAQDLSNVRAQAIGVRIEEDELVAPLLRTSWTSEELNDAADVLPDGQCLRRGLTLLDDETLAGACLRLGIRIDPPPWSGSGEDINTTRLAAEQAVLRTLIDGHLLAILLATLPGEAHRLLAALVRGEVDDATLARLDPPGELTAPRLDLVGESPVQVLRACALAFGGEATEGPRLWVPVELQRRIDGVLRAFGV